MTNESDERGLRCLGSEPAFPEPLHIGRPNLGDREQLFRRLNEALDRRWLTNNGQLLLEFERELADLSGVKHAIAFANATQGIEWLVRGLHLTGEIIVPDFTFVATAHGVLTAGCSPVLADVDPESHLIDVESVERLIGPDTAAIMGVHLWALPCNVDALEEIGRRHGIPVVFDAAHAMGATHRGQPIARSGTASVYSFHATKFVNSLEGGAVVTDDEDLAANLRLSRNFGFAGYDNAVVLGTNGKMDEFRAAVGLGSLEAMPSIVAKNRSNWNVYDEELSFCSGLDLVLFPAGEESNYQYVVANVRPDAALTRDEILDVLWSENIQARRYFFPGLHRMPAFADLRRAADLSGSLLASESVLVLPTGQTVGHADIRSICRVVRSALAVPSAIRAALREGKLPRHPRHTIADR
ncbi:DegT/DnrJ/EryC1/StrS family aminotransferase [Planctomycetota bacterium]|nr:DegT/DnrJ/EryC1/StrS family aminotransferase [Planctomycetota bacterium]